MDLAKIISGTKLFLNFLLHSYETCINDNIHNFAKYVINSKHQEKILQPTEPNIEVKTCKHSIKKDSKTYFDTNLSGLPHLEAISYLLGKPVEVYDENECLKFKIGPINDNVPPLRVQYHKNRRHYTLIGNREPFAHAKGPMCLYNCISDQISTDPVTLKAWTLECLQSKKQYEIYINVDPCWGGASYTGNGPPDAAWYLNNCQGKRGYRFPALAHPRGHASNPEGVGIEQYSHSGRKTGFESYEDQDFATHYALANQKTQESMQQLNQGSIREVVHISGRDLALPRSLTGGEWYDGRRTGTFEVNTVTLVIQHYDGKFNDPEAPVFIQTMYPRYP